MLPLPAVASAAASAVAPYGRGDATRGEALPDRCSILRLLERRERRGTGGLRAESVATLLGEGGARSEEAKSDPDMRGLAGSGDLGTRLPRRELEGESPRRGLEGDRRLPWGLAAASSSRVAGRESASRSRTEGEDGRELRGRCAEDRGEVGPATGEDKPRPWIEEEDLRLPMPVRGGAGLAGPAARPPASSDMPELSCDGDAERRAGALALSSGAAAASALPRLALIAALRAFMWLASCAGVMFAISSRETAACPGRATCERRAMRSRISSESCPPEELPAGRARSCIAASL